jgi:hypothetical protein
MTNVGTWNLHNEFSLQRIRIDILIIHSILHSAFQDASMHRPTHGHANSKYTRHLGNRPKEKYKRVYIDRKTQSVNI